MQRQHLAHQLRSLLGELTRFARFLAGSSADPDELVQETVARALRSSGDLRDDQSMRAWVFAIARNVHVDQRRARAGRDRFVVLEGGLDELAALDAATTPAPPTLIERADLERALDELPEGARTALLLTDLWEFDHEEVARILDIPVGTVKSRVARARAHVAASLGKTDTAGRRRA